MTNLKHGLPELPKRFRKLPVDARGYPVPWFVSKTEDGWDFRCIRPNGVLVAIHRRTCWLCGDPLGCHLTFVLGPMCAVTRTNSEPPSHHDCAEFAVKACPFLTNPEMRRSPRDMPEGSRDAAGIHLPRNPGVMCLWTTRSFEMFNAGNGVLLTVGDPDAIEWFARGRAATREEVEASVSGGVPLLRAASPEPEAQRDIDQRLEWFNANLLPVAA